MYMSDRAEGCSPYRSGTSLIRFYEVLRDETTSDTFYSAAVGLDDEGYRTVDEVASKLFETCGPSGLRA
ncbi:hypothetical protein [Rhizobium mongolense]|uniref:Uncharacterized protein n=1 Tax=Rhizobium mongolense TaxID=57676 RepID=A0A7W6RUQ3_9HYPH|nr:hypothetical protein [Rhizobium mongolense]MBB4278908.1 hypothetical protein [Rhizobium mongolense]